MSRNERLTAIVAVVVAAGLAAGCVDQGTSLQIRGVVQFQGSLSKEEITCGEGMNSTDLSKSNYSCSESVEAGSAQNYWGGGTVNAQGLQQPAQGQFGFAKTAYTESEYCSRFQGMNGTQRYLTEKYRSTSFQMTFDMVNQLRDGREVGAEGQGGGGGGYQNIQLDTNDVYLRRLELTFPNDPASELERTYEFTYLAESGGGAVAADVTLFTGADTQDLERVHRKAYRQQVGGNYDPSEPVTVDAQFHLKGETVAENEVQSNKFIWPLKICATDCTPTPRCEYSTESGGGG